MPKPSEAEALTALRQQLPDATEAERLRFLRARDGNVTKAAQMLGAYLDWREATLPLPEGAATLGHGLLKEWVCFLDEVKSRDSSKVLLVQAARCVPEACTNEQHAAAVASLLDQHLARDLEARVSIIIDVGGISGARNASPKLLFPVIRELNRVLGQNFPERVSRLLIYPVPWTLRSIWVAVRTFLDKATADKAKLFAGDANGGRVPPELDAWIVLGSIRSSVLAQKMMIDAVPC
eukprot:CAMPEP_0183337528 /NCGR_PEP_ID=MMETSP0164_2-20130417/5137_1 /TAXON_ID=221442 /ORGANISM="Coccolithus pelagicus ssp braarudi, Strain PLY182g" /LENGTH=235 /DNA_ID=CAMNT_0025507227 /DNA_START=11 /DNA_END=718 /DNA_ORIENTATION=+